LSAQLPRRPTVYWLLLAASSRPRRALRCWLRTRALPTMDAWLRDRVMSAQETQQGADGATEAEYGQDHFESLSDEEDNDDDTEPEPEPEGLLTEPPPQAPNTPTRRVGVGGEGALPELRSGQMSSPSSSLSSPEHGANPITNLQHMLAQMREMRRQTLMAVERLAPHMPELVTMVEGLELEAARHQASFDALVGAERQRAAAAALVTGEAVAERQGRRRLTRAGGGDARSGGGGRGRGGEAAEPSVSIDVTRAGGLRARG
jgi:hypothetical protein